MELEAGGSRGQPSAIEAVRTYLRTFTRLSPNAWHLLVATVCIYTSWGVFGVLFNLYLVASDHTLAYIGLIAAVTTIGQAAISPLMAWTLRHADARTTLTLGAALQMLTLTLAAIITNGTMLAIVAGLSGAALSVVTIPVYPYMMEHSTKQERSHLFSAYFAASQIGTMIGSLLSGALPALALLLPATLRYGLVGQDRVALIAGASIALIGVWQFRSMRGEAQPVEGAERPLLVMEEEVVDDRLHSDVVVMLLTTSLIALVLGATMPFFNVYFAQRLHASAAVIGTIYAASGVFCTMAAFLAPVVGGRGRLQGFSATRTLTAPIFVMFWLHPGLFLAASGYTARNVLATVSGALENTFAMEVLPARLRATVASWRSFTFNGAWSLGSLLAGVLVARFGYEVIFVVGGVLTAVASAVYFSRFAGRDRGESATGNPIAETEQSLP